MFAILHSVFESTCFAWIVLFSVAVLFGYKRNRAWSHVASSFVLVGVCGALVCILARPAMLQFQKVGVALVGIQYGVFIL